MKERDTCYACVVKCKRVVEINDGPYKVSPRYGGPEYETLGTFGSYCGVDDLAAVSMANQICNEYAVDSIAAGATIAFAMECYEKGVITKEQTNGLDLKFGNADAMIQALYMLVKGEGEFGRTLGMGSAVHATLAEGEICATVEIKINYFKPVREGDLICTTVLVNRGKTLANLDSSIHCGDLLVAKANGTYAVFRPSKPNV